MSAEGASVTTLDALVKDEGIDGVDLVKLDVDGYECAVLDGSAEVLEQHRPVIVSEIAPHALEAAGRTIDDLLDRFAAAHIDWRRWAVQSVTAAEVSHLTAKRLSTNVIAYPT